MIPCNYLGPDDIPLINKLVTFHIHIYVCMFPMANKFMRSQKHKHDIHGWNLGGKSARLQGLLLKMFAGPKIFLQDQKENEKRLPDTKGYCCILKHV